MKQAKLWSVVGFWVIGLLALAGLPLWPAQTAQAEPMVIATIPVGQGPAGVGVNPNTNRIYVANVLSNTVSVIDGATHAVIATIPVDEEPVRVGVNPTTNRIYITHGDPANRVTVINGANHTIITTIPASPATDLNGIAVNPITNRIYVTSFDPGGRVVVINGATNTIQTFVSVAANPRSVAVNPATNKIYVGHGSFFQRRRITLIDGETLAASDGPEVGQDHSGIVVNALTHRIYVHKGDLGNVAEGRPSDPYAVVSLNGASNTVLTTTSIISGEGGIALNPETNRLYVSSNFNNMVSILDSETNSLLQTIPVGQGPDGIAVNPNTQRVYVANNLDGTVSVIEDLTISTYVKVIKENGQPVAGARVYRNGNLLPQLTNAAGIVGLDGLNSGDKLVALTPVFTQPSPRQNHSGWAYQVNQTSMSLNAQGNLQPFIVSTPNGVQTLTVKPSNSLTLFNLVVSVEWDATALYLQDLLTATQKAADFLYDISDGQMTFGQVTIYDRAQSWTNADIQILAKNVTQPHAYIAGITDPDPSHLIRLGRFWNGNTANSGNWSQPNGFKTLVHEFGHYGLGLYDEYFGFDRVGDDLAGQHQAFCTEPRNWNQLDSLSGGASIMDYQYKTSELADAGRWTIWCQETAQHQLNQGEADWQTLLRRFGDKSGQNRWQLITPDQRAGLGKAVPGPESLAPFLPFPAVSINNTGESPQPFTLQTCQNGLPYTGGAWVTLYLSNGKAMDEGLTDTGGNLEILGARAEDTLRVISIDDKISGSTTVPPSGCLELNLAEATALNSQARPYLRMWPTTSSGALDGLRLVVAHTLPGDNLTYALTGPDTFGQLAPIAYNSTTNDHRTQASYVPPAQAGHARVLGSHASQFIDLNVDYRLQQATNISDTTLFSNDGNLNLYMEAGSLSRSEVYFLIASPWGLPGPLPSGLNIFGEAYEITASNNVDNFTKPAVFNLGYDGASQPVTGSLGIYRWNSQTNVWQPLGGEVDTTHQQVVISTTKVGLYALLGVVDKRYIHLPIILK